MLRTLVLLVILPLEHSLYTYAQIQHKGKFGTSLEAPATMLQFPATCIDPQSKMFPKSKLWTSLRTDTGIPRSSSGFLRQVYFKIVT
jgi:hypothetical protein